MEKYLYLVGRNILNYQNGNEIQFQKVEIIKETEKSYKVGINKEFRSIVYKSQLNTVNNFERVFCKTLEDGIITYKNYCLLQLEISQSRVENYKKRIENIDNFKY